MMDERGSIMFWNRAAEAIFGYTAQEALGQNCHTLLAPRRYHDACRTDLRRFLTSGEGPTIGRRYEFTAMRKNGTEFPLEISLSALQREGKWLAVGILQDISRRKNMEGELRMHHERLELMVEERTEELREANELLRREIIDRTRTEKELYQSERFLSTIFDSFHDPVCIVDREFTIVKFNDAYCSLLGKTPKVLSGKKCYEARYGQTTICENCVVEKTLQSKDPCSTEKRTAMPDGSEAWVEMYSYPIFDRSRNVTHVVEYTRDITHRKKEEEEKRELIRTLNHLSTTDVLTGLYNRRALNDILKHEIERANRYGIDLSLILIDVDNFKLINDSFGHTVGDQALKLIADALVRSLRKTDIPGRYGGDELMVILPETCIEGARNLAEKIRRTIEEVPLDLPGKKRITLGVSIGVAGCCAPPENIDTIVALADKALYDSKLAGRNRVTVSRQ
jgi:diguanylate cyclase (GGDEF)-like protein/PAS domain S-box-containing protein